MYPRVSIIILNWNGWRDTIECLESLYRIDYPNYDVIVVDNGSHDDSIQKIKEYAGGRLKLIQNSLNIILIINPSRFLRLTKMKPSRESLIDLYMKSLTLIEE